MSIRKHTPIVCMGVGQLLSRGGNNIGAALGRCVIWSKMISIALAAETFRISSGQPTTD
jgi:hypothetical protein